MADQALSRNLVRSLTLVTTLTASFPRDPRIDHDGPFAWLCAAESGLLRSPMPRPRQMYVENYGYQLRSQP